MSDSDPGRADRKLPLLSAALILTSLVVYVVAARYHPNSPNQLDYPAIFVQYANTYGWTVDHAGWFLRYVLILSGVLVLFHALDSGTRMQQLVGRLGATFTAVAMVLSAVRYAVDGVVLKRAVDAWLAAPEADKGALFASALTARWMEEATASYQTLVIGVTFLLLIALILWTGQVSRVVAYLLLPGAFGYLALSWILGISGFAPVGAIPNFLADFAPFFAGVWLVVSALRSRPATSSDIKPFAATPAASGGIVR